MTITCSNYSKIMSISLFFKLPRWLSGKESACQCRRWRFNPWVRKTHWRRTWQLTPVLLPGKSHRQRSLVGLQFMGPQSIRHNLLTKQQIFSSQFIKNFIYYFLLHWAFIAFAQAFSSCGNCGLLFLVEAGAFHCSGFSCFGIQAPGAWAQ